LHRNLTKDNYFVSKIYGFLFLVMLICISCEWHLRPFSNGEDGMIHVDRYDRIETLYLTTGDISALHQMNTSYPQQTRVLIEDMLQLGNVNDTNINTKFLFFFQDTTLQTLLADVAHEYGDMDDIDEQLTQAFDRLRELIPSIAIPQVYSQIGSLDQSIVVIDGALGISLDKYMGADYPLYKRYGYTEKQRCSMNRSFIVLDCLSFYLLSLYPLPQEKMDDKEERELHIGRIQYVVNQCLEKEYFKSPQVKQAADTMMKNQHLTVEQLLMGLET